MAMTPTSIALPQEKAGLSPGRAAVRTMVVRLLAGLFLLSLFVPLIGAWRHWDFAAHPMRIGGWRRCRFCRGVLRMRGGTAIGGLVFIAIILVCGIRSFMRSRSHDFMGWERIRMGM